MSPRGALDGRVGSVGAVLFSSPWLEIHHGSSLIDPAVRAWVSQLIVQCGHGLGEAAMKKERLNDSASKRTCVAEHEKASGWAD